MRRRYSVLDVFTHRPFAGNPLAVVLDSEGLETGDMQAIAREFNLSETVFVLPAEHLLHTARIRIFTPAIEMPFAGHPTVGTACLLAAERFKSLGVSETIVTLEARIGLISCAVKAEEGQTFAEFDAPRLSEMAGPGASPAQAAEALGLAPADIGFGAHMPTRYTAGVPFHFVPVRSRAVLARVRPNPIAWEAAFGAGDHPNAYVYSREGAGDGRTIRARMFWPGAGVGEDPATGSAAAALAGVLARFEPPAEGITRYAIEQGYEMGRPSDIMLEIEMHKGALKRVRVGGGAVIVAEGELLDRRARRRA